MILQLLLAMFAGWIQRHQQQVITYLQAENHVFKAQLGGRWLCLTDTERRRLAALAYQGLLPPVCEILLQAASRRSNGLEEESTLVAFTVGFT